MNDGFGISPAMPPTQSKIMIDYLFSLVKVAIYQ